MEDDFNAMLEKYRDDKSFGDSLYYIKEKSKKEYNKMRDIEMNIELKEDYIDYINKNYTDKDLNTELLSLTDTISMDHFCDEFENNKCEYIFSYGGLSIEYSNNDQEHYHLIRSFSLDSIEYYQEIDNIELSIDMKELDKSFTNLNFKFITFKIFFTIIPEICGLFSCYSSFTLNVVILNYDKFKKNEIDKNNINIKYTIYDYD